MDQIIRIAWELNENAPNRYKLVYEISELAKKLVDEVQMKKSREEFEYEDYTEGSYKKENPSNSQPSGNHGLIIISKYVLQESIYYKEAPILVVAFHNQSGLEGICSKMCRSRTSKMIFKFSKKRECRLL